MQNAPREQREVRGLTISAMGAENPTTKFDLTLYVMEARGRIVGEVEYNTDLFDAEQHREDDEKPGGDAGGSGRR